MNLKKSIEKKRHSVLNNFSKKFNVNVICEDHIDDTRFDVYLSLSDLYAKEYWVLHVDTSLVNSRGTQINNRYKTIYSFESIKELPNEVKEFYEQNKQIQNYEEFIDVKKYKFSGNVDNLEKLGFRHISSICDGFWIYTFKVNNCGRFSAYFSIKIDTSKEDQPLTWDCCDIDGFGQWIMSLTRNEIDKINEKLKDLKQNGVLIDV